MADVACPTGYTQITEDVVYISSGNSCPNGDTKLGGEYGEDSILNCIGAQSDTTSICTYFAEQCQIGMSFDGTSHQPCPDGAYYCDGSGTATPGVAGCSSVCPTPRNTVGAASINPGAGARQDLNGNDLYDSVNECGVLYMFVEEFIANNSPNVDILESYKPDSDANVRGNAYVYCAYNSETDEYDINCVGHPLYCAGGHYSSGWGSDTHENKLDDGIPVYGASGSFGSDNFTGTLSLDEFIQVYCEPVGENYYSPSASLFLDENGVMKEEYEYEYVLDVLMSRMPCPANSSTKGATTATYCTCNDGYTLTGTIGGNIQTTTDACRPIPEFSIITTFMDAGTEFSFKISAAGEYTIDWGDGNVESIVKTDTEDMTFSHTYTSGGVHTIGIGGDATEYYTSPNGSSEQPAISFENNTNVAKLVGSLGAIFGGSATSMFNRTFANCTSLTEIPENLFSGQRSGADRMFYGTFSGCTSLTEVPANLFSGITDSAEYMFYYTFDGCTSLTKIAGNPFPNLTGNAPGMFNQTFSNCTLLNNIPKDLFAGVSGSATDMFDYTFANCTSLTNIPKELFSGISGGAEGMFNHTFHNCTSLVDIPATLFSGINTSAYQMFNQTFRNCTSLTEIPGTLFQNIKGESAQEVFSGTFANCTSLTSIPNGLFKNITGKPAEYAFYGVFYECTNLTGTVPVDLFENLDSADYVSGPMEFIFNGTNLDTQCPSGTYQYITGFESDWDGHVACTPCPTAHPNSAAGATSETQCYTTCTKQCTPQTCPDNATCTDGAITSTTGTQYVGGTCDAASSICEMTVNCNNGYDKQDGIRLIEQTPLIPVDYHEYGDDYGFINANGNLSGNSSDFYESAGLTESNTWATHFDYGTVYGRASCQPSANAGITYIFNNLESVMGGEMTVADFESGLSAISGTAKAKFASNLITELQNGTKSESDLIPALWAVFGTETDANYSTTDTGQYCYCQMTGVTPTDGTKQSVAGASWVFYGDNGSADNCAIDCAGHCAGNLQDVDPYIAGFRAAVFGSLRAENTAMCVAKIIDVPSGYYLPANTTEYVLCPANSYCPGVSGITLHETQNQGLKPCPDNYMSDKGATSETQCYTTCTKQCIPQTCPDNSINCVHGNDVTTGIQYVGGACDAKESACNISFDCSTGYTKSGLAQWAINNVDLLIENETDLPMCGLDGFGSCDELKPGEWASYYTDGLPIKNATGVAVCNSVPGDDSSFDARINKDADFDLNTTGNYCWMKVQTVNDSFLPASWVYGWQYDSPEQCADDCGWSSNPDFQTVELAIIWGAQYDVCVANEYTVTYDCNGGAGNTTETVIYNSVFDPRTDVCEYDGYLFAGWTLNGTTVSDSFTWDYTDNQTLVATWTQCAPGSYCTGDGTSNTCPTDNSGRVVTSTTGAVANTDCYVTCPETISIENSKSVIVTDKTPNYNGTIYPECTYTATCNDGYSVQNNGTANPICTPNTYTVTYIAEPVNSTVDVVYNTAFTFSQPIPDKTGYTGTGWLGQNNQLYTLNQTIIYDMAYNLSVAPQYVANEYTVTYDCNGGAGTTTETVTYNSVFAPRTDVCEYDGYLFAGWTLNGTTVSDSFTWNYTDNQTLVATWTRLSLDCPYNEELVNGKCTPCNRDNALSYSPTGNCMVTECTDGFYPYMQECVPENITCDAPNADMAYKHWNVENRAYGPCIISECKSGFHVSANTCVPNTQSCVLEHGIGEQTWDLIQEQWGKCIATECMPGYTTDSRLTNDMLDGQCGRCSNMFVDNDLAVSSYISECEIASCMYQGEKYTLENNECILICDEYSDETGSRYWNGKKCVHDCADGYTIWE